MHSAVNLHTHKHNLSKVEPGKDLCVVCAANGTCLSQSLVNCFDLGPVKQTVITLMIAMFRRSISMP